MRTRILLLGLMLVTFTAQSQKMTRAKKAIVASVEAHKAELIRISDSR